VGGRRYTSVEAIERFIRGTNQGPPSVSPPSVPPTKSAAADIERELDSEGF
jgi:hypothetical protein